MRFSLDLVLFMLMMVTVGTAAEEQCEHASQCGEETGILTEQQRYPDGSYYDGDVNNVKKRHGFGTLVFGNGKKYIGHWKDGFYDGHGTFYRNPDSVEYDGSWKQGKKSGQGTYYWENGRMYKGEWKDDKMEGFGEQTWPSGSRYAGNHQGNRREGEGFFEDVVNNHNYTGEFENGKFHGKGTLIYGPNSRNEVKSFVGQWKDDRKVQGEQHYIDGRMYKGPFRSNHPDGEGVKTWPDGRRYTGGFKLGTAHGYGVHVWPEGDRYEGNWERNVRHGHGTFYWADGRVETGLWENDEFVSPQ